MRLSSLVNLVLVFIAFLLLINLFYPMSSMTGKISYEFDSSSPECFFVDSGEMHTIAIENCCYEIQRQLACSETKSPGLQLKCYVSILSQHYYLINYKAFNYCKNEGYDVKKK